MGGMNVWGDADALKMRDFGGGTLFDGDAVAIGDGEIEGGNRRGDIEGNVVFFGQNGDLVSADLVAGVAVGAVADGAGDDGANFSGLQEVTPRMFRLELGAAAPF